MVRHQSVAENYQIVEIDQACSPQRGFITLRDASETGIDLPVRRIPVEMNAPVLAHVVCLIGLADPEQTLRYLFERRVGLTRRRERQWIWHVQSREPRIGHKDVAKAETVHSAHEKIGRVAQAKRFQPPCQFPRALLTVGDAGDTARRPHIFGKDPRQLQHQRLGLSAPRPARTTQCPREL